MAASFSITVLVLSATRVMSTMANGSVVISARVQDENEGTNQSLVSVHSRENLTNILQK